jgi:protein SCO1/2
VDPERDSVPVLKRYADRNGVNHDIWWMLTGPKKSIYDFAINEIKLAVQDGGQVDSNFIHTERFVLLDRDHVIRGYYNGLDSTSLDKLSKDIGLLMLSVDDNPQQLPFDPVLMAIFFAITVVVTIIVIRLIFRKKNANESTASTSTA